jgi:hypothetical protein
MGTSSEGSPPPPPGVPTMEDLVAERRCRVQRCQQRERRRYVEFAGSSH